MIVKTETEIRDLINHLQREMMGEIAAGVPDRNMTGDIHALGALYWVRFDFDWSEALEQALTFVRSARAGR